MSQAQTALEHAIHDHAAPAGAAGIDIALLRKHLQGADIPTLLMSVAHLTGDLGLLKPEWRPEIDVSGVAVSKLAPATHAEILELCHARLTAFLASGAEPPRRPTLDQLHRFGEWLVGPVLEPYLPLVAEELVTEDDDPRRPTWHKDKVAPDRDFHVAIIGAGESGLIAAYRLKQAGVPFTIYEKNADVGGTWLENHYPGCRVDINSFYYSYAFARRTWDDYFAESKDVLAYLRRIAEDCGLYEHIRFETEVESARWNERDARWELRVSSRTGNETVRSNMAVSAVGQLNRPKMPDIEGIDRFRGPAFHSARWDHAVDLAGKRVGVIGTGASALQFIREIAKGDTEVTVFARTTPWLLPTPDLLQSIGESKRWLLDNLPGYALWYRASLVMVQSVGFLDEVVVDPEYPPTETAVAARNDALRRAILDWLEPQIADRPDLRELLIPDSPLGAKRIIRDDGCWVRTLKRANVNVQRERIAAITETGIRCADGSEHELDVIIYGTGFEASGFLMPMQVTGLGGVDLHERWQDDARAYLGAAIPDFPNLFCMYGPNTNLVVYGSIIMFSELTAGYIVDAARLLLEGGHDAMSVRREVYETYNERVDAANRLRAWGFSKVNSWYKNSKGRVTQNFPFPAWEFWQRTHRVVPGDYELS